MQLSALLMTARSNGWNEKCLRNLCAFFFYGLKNISLLEYFILIILKEIPLIKMRTFDMWAIPGLREVLVLGIGRWGILQLILYWNFCSVLNKISEDLFRYSSYLQRSSLLLMSIFYQTTLILHTKFGGICLRRVRYC